MFIGVLLSAGLILSDSNCGAEMKEPTTYKAVWAADDDWEPSARPPRPVKSIGIRATMRALPAHLPTAAVTGVTIAAAFMPVRLALGVMFESAGPGWDNEIFWQLHGLAFVMGALMWSLLLAWKCARHPEAELCANWAGVLRLARENRALIFIGLAIPAVAVAISVSGLEAQKYNPALFHFDTFAGYVFLIMADAYAPGAFQQKKEVSNGEG